MPALQLKASLYFFALSACVCVYVYMHVCVCVCAHTCDCMYSSLGPPAVNKSLVYEWHRTVTRLHSQLQEVHNKFLVQLQNCQEVINMACVSEVEHHRV